MTIAMKILLTALLSNGAATLVGIAQQNTRGEPSDLVASWLGTSLIVAVWASLWVIWA